MSRIIPTIAYTALLAAGTFLLSACGDSPPKFIGYQGQSIINGDPDTSDAHQAVVYIQIDVGGGYAAACTGTMITSDVVLTAGHCVGSDSGAIYATSKFSVMFGNRISYGGVTAQRSVSEVLRHPDYGVGSVSNDIALLRLSQAAPSTVQPIPFLPEHLAVDDYDLGSSVEFVGFGQDENGDTGVKLHVFGQVRWICGDDIPAGYVCGFDEARNIFGLPNTLCFDQEDGGTCHGDSGGPGLIMREGVEYVAGVTSYGDREDCTVFGCSTKVDAYQEFILGFVGGGLGQECASQDDCAFGFCVQGICCDMACDSPCQTCAAAGHEGRCRQAENGAQCSNGDACDGQEICLMGDCVPGDSLDCDDGDVCTEDQCDPILGCQNTARPEGYACGDCMMCKAGACVKANCSSGCQSAGGEAPPRGGNLSGILLVLALLGLMGLAGRRVG